MGVISYLSYNLILQIIANRQLSHEWLNSRTRWRQSYDYIVVGAGTAGSAVAARLAEDGQRDVLVIEAGGPQNNFSDIPAFQNRLFESELDWNYPIVPQRNSFWAFRGNQRTFHRGKVFGGSSTLNRMNYYRENPEHFRYWTDITGVKNWDYEDVLPYFLKSENNTDWGLIGRDATVHTAGGPVTVRTANPLDPMLQLYLEEAPKLGYPTTHPDGRKPFGSTILQTTIKDGVRQTTSLAFLEGNNKKNLHILGKTLVTKILFNRNKRAIGVQFYRDNNFYSVYARKKVILSAGAIGSPKLLLLSGIGPKHHLQDMNIKVVSDLKVGDNSLYTSFVTVYFDIKNQLLIERPKESAENLYKYYVENSGPLAYKASATTCFQQVHYPGRPNLCNGVVLPRINFHGNDLEEIVKHFKEEVKEEWREYYRPYLDRSYFYLILGLKRPQSIGSIRLKSKNPFQDPLIDPCTLCSEQDVSDLAKTFKLSMDLFLSPAFDPYIEAYKKPIPGCSPCPNDFFCESYIRCYIQTFPLESFPTGGCRMGTAIDKDAVVDERLRVFGVSGLYVIDSSIFPVNTEQSTAITIMIAEKGADIIKEDDNKFKIYINNKPAQNFIY